MVPHLRHPAPATAPRPASGDADQTPLGHEGRDEQVFDPTRNNDPSSLVNHLFLSGLKEFAQSTIGIICDAKGSELGLVFFTYCLVAVGWFTVRSNELTTQTLERGYLAVVPIEIEKRFVTGKNWNPSFYDESDPQEISLRLSVSNPGRTNATIKKDYVEFSREPPTGDTPTYHHGDETIADYAFAAGETETLPIDHATSFIGNQFVWGYVEYFDVFKIKRNSRFCVAIFPPTQRHTGSGAPSYGKLQLAGSDGWRECN